MVQMVGLLSKKVVAITGSSSGIGRAAAIACAHHGARLVLHHIGNSTSKQDVKTLGEEIDRINQDRGSFDTYHVELGLDLTEPTAGEKLVIKAKEAFGQINVLVNNAGICTFSGFHNVTKAMLDREMAINFTAAYMVTQAATKQMVLQGAGGSIVSISSIAALLGAIELSHYSSTKAALLGMTASGAVELGPSGIRFNTIRPGTIHTTINDADLKKGNKGAEVAARLPLRRLGKPEDIAGAVVYFASDLSKYVTGQSLLVDGGASVSYQ